MCHCWSIVMYNSRYYTNNEQSLRNCWLKRPFFSHDCGWYGMKRLWKPFLAFENKVSATGMSCLVVHCHIAYIPYKLPCSPSPTSNRYNKIRALAQAGFLSCPGISIPLLPWTCETSRKWHLLLFSLEDCGGSASTLIQPRTVIRP